MTFSELWDASLEPDAAGVARAVTSVVMVPGGDEDSQQGRGPPPWGYTGQVSRGVLFGIPFL